jgi:ankyrin repeat protein
VERARALLAAGEDPAARDDRRLTPLHWAAECNAADVARVLLAAGADPDARDDIRWMPLHTAVVQGATEVAHALLDAGADPMARDREDVTPLHLAAFKGSTTMLSLLVSHGADINNAHSVRPLAAGGKKLPLGAETPLLVAANHHRVAAVQQLLALGADPEAAGGYLGSTPLSMAASNGWIWFAQELLKHGADPLAHRNGVLTCDLARDKGHRQLAMLLADAAAAAATARLRAAAAAAHAQAPLHGDAAKLQLLLKLASATDPVVFTRAALSVLTLDQLIAVAEGWGAGDTMRAVQSLLRPVRPFSFAAVYADAVLLALSTLLFAAAYTHIMQPLSRQRLRHAWRALARAARELLAFLRDTAALVADALPAVRPERQRTPPPPPRPPAPPPTVQQPAGIAARRRRGTAAATRAAASGRGAGATLQPEPAASGTASSVAHAAVEHPAAHAASGNADAANDAPPPVLDDAPPATAQPAALVAAAPAVLPPPPHAADADDTAAECTVCMDAPREAAFVPCGHRVACMACAGVLLRSRAARCPCCNAPSTQAIRIFL